MIALLIASLSIIANPPDLTPIPSREASRHVGERRVVELSVLATKDEVSRKLYYLDSEADFRNPANLAVAIDYSDLPTFRAAGIADPIAHFKGKKIRVTGTILRDKGNGDALEIKVRDPGSIAIINDRIH